WGHEALRGLHGRATLALLVHLARVDAQGDVGANRGGDHGAGQPDQGGQEGFGHRRACSWKTPDCGSRLWPAMCSPDTHAGTPKRSLIIAGRVGGCNGGRPSPASGGLTVEIDLGYNFHHQMIKTRVQTQIQRPVAAVFAYVTSVAHFPRVYRGVIREARQ